MKVLQIHNLYQLRGGEDFVVQNEKELLENNGIEVVQYLRDSREIEDFTSLKKITSIKDFFFSIKTYEDIKEIIEKESPDVCHIHNWIPLISASVFKVCKKYKLPIIQTLHNYRYFCPKINFYRDNHICQDCLNAKNYFPAIKFKCYRNSYNQTFLLSKLLKDNIDEIKKGVKLFICPSNFVRGEFQRNGFPSSKLITKPNFLSEDQGTGKNFDKYFLFAGRFEKTKGSDILLEAFKKLSHIQLIVIGEKISKQISSKNIVFKDFIADKKTVYEYIQNAKAVVFPSLTFEVMPMTIIEAFACGKPVIASRLGAMEEMIEDGKTGLLFEPGNVDDLINKIKWAANNPDEIMQMGSNARQEFLNKYTADKNISILKEIYNFALQIHKLSFNPGQKKYLLGNKNL